MLLITKFLTEIHIKLATSKHFYLGKAYVKLYNVRNLCRNMYMSLTIISNESSKF